MRPIYHRAGSEQFHGKVCFVEALLHRNDAIENDQCCRGLLEFQIKECCSHRVIGIFRRYFHQASNCSLLQSVAVSHQKASILITQKRLLVA